MSSLLLSVLTAAASLAASVTATPDTAEAIVMAPDTVSEVLIDTIPPADLRGRERVGLVLSGGGAKGIAHVGVIKALEDNDIPVDYVTGTSMGAIVGSLYSCGWSPERMLELFTSSDFLDWSTGTINKNKIYYYNSPDPTPKWISVNINFKDEEALPYQVIPTSLVSPLPMNIEFLKLYSPYTDQCGGDFNSLFVPFRCVASDVYHKHKVVLGNGSLGDAVRASMSFPLVFKPIKLDGVLMYDGGIYDNFPVDVMREDFNPDFIIGVSVSGADSKPVQGDVYSQLEDMIIQNNDYKVPPESGIKIQVPVLDYGVLQFNKAKTIYDIGYKTGLSMVDSIKSRVSARVTKESVDRRRAVFARLTPRVLFDSVSVAGVNADQSRYLSYLFNRGGQAPFGLRQTENAYYRAVTDGTLSILVPQARFGARGNNTLLLDASVKRPWSIGVGGWITSSSNSMLYLNLGFHTLSLNSLDVSIGGWIGQSYYAGMLSARFSLRTRVPSFLKFDGVLQRQKFFDNEVLFYKTPSPAFITEVDNFARASFVWAIGRKMRGTVSLAGGYIADSYYPSSLDNFSDRSKDRTQYRIGVATVGIDQSTLDNELYPSSGLAWHSKLRFSYEMSRFLPQGEKQGEGGFSGTPRASVDLFWKQFFPVRRTFRFGASAYAYATAQQLRQNYTATLIHAPAFAPTPSTKNYFNVAFRSDNFVAAGVIPIWTPRRNMQIRGDFYAYAPLRELKDMGESPAEYGAWLNRVEFLGEVAAVYNFPFASLSVYVNYLSYPSNNWNFGINFGLFFQAPKLLR